MIKIEFTVQEVDELQATCISMYSKLLKDKYVDKETIEFWYKLQDKLMMAKIRQS